MLCSLLKIILFLPFIDSFFINIRFGSPFRVSNKEVNKKIIVPTSLKNKNVLKKINGFYGMIGPDVNVSTVNSLYELFTADGNIQGIFLENGELTYIKHYIRTDKLLYEEKNGIIPKNIWTSGIFMLLDKLNMFPNIMGVANTAVLNVKNKYFALFERDQPYQIDIDFKNKTINTVKKMKIKDVKYLSGHTKYDGDAIKTIDYNVLLNEVYYYELNETMNVKKKRTIKTNYLPVVHDFLSTKDSLIISDSPLLIVNINKIINTTQKTLKIPVVFDKNKKTFFHILNKKTNEVKQIESRDSFYIFHYADYYENNNYIEMYAPLYDNMDFSDINLKGNYRKFIINKKTNNTRIERNEELEKYDLDFPLKYKNNVVLRNIENKTINGFIICEKLDIKKKIFFKDKSICGEPAIACISNNYYLLAFAYNKKESYLIIINLSNYEVTEIPIDENINIGFHSIFVTKN